MKLNEYPKQVIILGGGLTADGSPTQETMERALTAVYYGDRYEADRMIFSGGQGFLNPNLTTNQAITEADVMADIAIENGTNPATVIRDREPKSTFESFLSDQLLDQPTTVITSDYHMNRALKMARLTLDAPLLGIVAMSEYSGKAKPPINERLLNLATQLAMIGVKHGDIEAIKQRNERVATIATASTGILRLLLRKHTSVEAKKAVDFGNDKSKH